MRKTEERMIRAIRTCRQWRGKNTEVLDDNGFGWGVYLHGHRIACGPWVEGEVKVVGASLCGWDTVTTRSRLYALGVDVWKLRLEEGFITQKQYMKHLRAAENERTRRKLLST